MKKAHLLLGVAAVAGLGLAVGAFVWLTSPRHSINPDTMERIRAGMKEEEVEAVLGGPYGQYFRGSVQFRIPGVLRSRKFQGARAGADALCDQTRCYEEGKWCVIAETKGWVGDEFAIWVTFDSEGRVLHTESTPVVHLERTAFDKLRQLLPW